VSAVKPARSTNPKVAAMRLEGMRADGPDVVTAQLSALGYRSGKWG
jgi:hypothetical protein